MRTEEEHIAGQGSGKKNTKSAKVPEKKMPAVVGLDVLSRAELSPLTSSSVAAHVGSSQSRVVVFLSCGRQQLTD